MGGDGEGGEDRRLLIPCQATPMTHTWHAISGTNATTVQAPDRESARARAAGVLGCGVDEVLVRYISSTVAVVDERKVTVKK